MGEMADDVIQEVFDFEDACDHYKDGKMSDEEAIDNGVIDENGVMNESGNKKSKSCKYCGESGFEWAETDRGWRLVKDGEEHRCSLPDSNEDKPKSKKQQKNATLSNLLDTKKLLQQSLKNIDKAIADEEKRSSEKSETSSGSDYVTDFKDHTDSDNAPASNHPYVSGMGSDEDIPF
jgi:hypothetical protein